MYYYHDRTINLILMLHYMIDKHHYDHFMHSYGPFLVTKLSTSTSTLLRLFITESECLLPKSK